MTTISAARSSLRRLARMYGVHATYTDGRGRRRHASQGSVLATLRALGAHVQTIDDTTDAAEARYRELWDRPLQPVVVAWGGREPSFELRGPTPQIRARAECHIQLEGGSEHGWTVELSDLPARQHTDIAGVRYESKRLLLPQDLSYGYHELSVELAGCRWKALLIAAPVKAFDDGATSWGVFLPVYALRSAGSWGVGDWSDVEALLRWLNARGGRVFSTLPTLAGFLGAAPFDPCPYLPASRLFWNELFVDLRGLPEFAICPEARKLVESTQLQAEIASLQSTQLVDYRRAMAAKRRVLEPLAQSLGSSESERGDDFRRWVHDHPLTSEYAAFRALGERLGRAWPEWPAPLRAGRLEEHRGDRTATLYHLYAQWVAAEQIDRVSGTRKGTGNGLYLDFPLGVHPDGFDVWRYRALFARDAAVGAPPDALFAEGQNWGAPPPHPDATRLEGYRYLRAALRQQLAHAEWLRIDHVMGLHRLYWIPQGFNRSDGVYVHYPADELYAIVCLESHRHRARIVGENLGTVPSYVNAAMSTHGLRKLYVAQFEVRTDHKQPLRHVPPRAVASLNTHDTPTLAGFLAGADIDERVSRDLVDPAGARSEHKQRRAARVALRRVALPVSSRGRVVDAEPARIMRGCLHRLARSVASLVLINLEDLWLEALPQNVPGTGPERPNWRRKARYPLERFTTMPDVIEALNQVAQTRGTRSRRRPRP